MSFILTTDDLEILKKINEWDRYHPMKLIKLHKHLVDYFLQRNYIWYRCQRCWKICWEKKPGISAEYPLQIICGTIISLDLINGVIYITEQNGPDHTKMCKDNNHRSRSF